MNPSSVLRKFAVVLPLLVAAAVMPVVTPVSKPHIRHWAMAARNNVAQRAPGDFALVGLSVPGDRPDGISVRTSRDGKRWGPWTPLEFEAEVGPDLDSDEKGAHTSMPVWTGTSRYIDVRGAPAGAKVHAIDPGPDPSLPASSAMASPSKPGIITRAQWGADESIRRGNPSYASSLKLAVVHHTATADSYAKSDSDNIVRSIYAYHVNTNGWDDIGYNFLVDRYGQIFEGRYGGVDRNVIGAHSQGFNTGSTGVSIIGNFASSKPPSAAMTSLKRIVSWRLDRATVDPAGSVTYTSGGSNKYPAGQRVRLRNVSAHKDVGRTACPGTPLYGALNWLRTYARSDGAPKLFNARVSRSVITPNRDGVADGVAVAGEFSSLINWKVEIVDHAGAVQYAVAGSGTTMRVNWYGKTYSGSYVPHGPYRFRVTGKGSAGSLRAYYVPVGVWRWANGTWMYTTSKITYVLYKGQLRPTHYQVRASRSRGAERVNVSSTVKSYYPVGPHLGFREGTLVSADGKVYIISDAKRRPTTKSVLSSKGFDTRGIIATSAAALRPHATGSTFTSTSPYPNGSALRSSGAAEAWVIGGIARPFLSRSARDSYVIRDVDMAGPADEAMAPGITSTRVGFRDGTLIRAANGTAIYMISDGKRRRFRSSAIFARMGFEAENIREVTPAELAFHPEGQVL